MKKQMLKSALIALAGVGLISGNVWAFQITFDDGINTAITISDGGAGDNSTATGRIDISTFTYGAYELSGTILTSNGTITDSNPLRLFMQNFTTGTNANGTLTITFEDTFETSSGWGYDLFNTHFASSYDTFDTMTYQTFINGVYSNTLFSTAAITSALAYDAIISTPALYPSITVKTVITLTSDGDSYSEASYNSTTTSNLTPVPEPASMLLLGTGLIGLTGLVRRKIS